MQRSRTPTFIVISAIVLLSNCGGGRDDVGRPVRVVSICFQPTDLASVVAVVDAEGGKGADLICLPETWRGQKTPEMLDGPTVTAMAALARRHRVYIVCPIDLLDGERRVNAAVLIDRAGRVAAIQKKVFPYWAELELTPPVTVPPMEVRVHRLDFGAVGIAICFDANFPEVWQELADQGAEIVVWPSAYSGGAQVQAHALNHHYYIVTSTYSGDCQVFDITGERILDQQSDGIHVSRITLDLDRGIYHENSFNRAPRRRLLAERGDDIELERFLTREKWFVLRAKRPGVRAREVAAEYGLEELRAYKMRCRDEIDRMREGR